MNNEKKAEYIPTLTIRGVSAGDAVQDVVGELVMTRQGAREVIDEIETWLAESGE